METLKRTRFRSYAGLLALSVLALPTSLMAAAPAPGPVAMAPPGASTNSTLSAMGGSMLIWPFDATQSGSADGSIGSTVANTLAETLAGSTQWQAAPLKPDSAQNSPMVTRAIAENALKGDLQRIVAAPTPTAVDAESVAHYLGYGTVLLGTVDRVQYDAATNEARVHVTWNLFDASTPSVAHPLASMDATGSSGRQPRQFSPTTVQAMAAQDAARIVAHQLSPRIEVKTLGRNTKKTKGQQILSAVEHYLPYVLGAGLAYLAVNSLHHSSSSSNNAPAGGIQPPLNALAEVETGGATGFHVGLGFNSSLSSAAVSHYVVFRRTAAGDTPISSIPNTGASSYLTADTSVVPGQSYTYYVYSVGYNGQSSSIVPFYTNVGSTTLVDGQPRPPTGLLATVVGHTVSLTWSPTPDTSFLGYYQVLRSTNPTTNFVLISPPLSVTTYADNSPDLTAVNPNGGISYFYYKVEAVANSTPAVFSPDSNVATAIILNNAPGR